MTSLILKKRESCGFFKRYGSYAICDSTMPCSSDQKGRAIYEDSKATDTTDNSDDI